MLVDSNILIYAAQPAHAHLRQFIAGHVPAVSAVSYVEVLGYHQLNDEERQKKTGRRCLRRRISCRQGFPGLVA
jgi:hypothetical protein